MVTSPYKWKVLKREVKILKQIKNKNGLRSSSRARNIRVFLQDFGSGTVATYFNYISLTQSGFENPPFWMEVENSNTGTPDPHTLLHKLYLFTINDSYKI